MDADDDRYNGCELKINQGKCPFGSCENHGVRQGCAKYYDFGKIFLTSNEKIFWKNNMISKYDFVEIRK